MVGARKGHREACEMDCQVPVFPTLHQEQKPCGKPAYAVLKAKMNVSEVLLLSH